MTEEPCDHDLSAGSRKVIHDVNIHGWHVVKVSSSGDHPGWAFSIGFFHTFQHPEVLMFGLGLDLMHQLINTLAAEIRAGQCIEADTEHGDLLKGYRCAFKSVDKVWYEYVLGYATWFYKGTDFPTLQCFWPDKGHRYPWDRDFDSSLASLQPLLFHRDPVQAQARALLNSLASGSKEQEADR